MNTKTNYLIPLIILVLSALFYFLNYALFYVFALSTTVICAILAGILSISSIILNKENYATHYQIASFFSGVIIFSEFISKIASGEALSHMDYVSIQFRYLAIFLILLSTLIGLWSQNHKKSLPYVMGISFVLTLVSINILFISQNIPFLHDDYVITEYFMITSSVNFLIILLIFWIMFIKKKNMIPNKEKTALLLLVLYFSDTIHHLHDIKFIDHVFIGDLLLVSAFVFIFTTSFKQNVIEPIRNIKEQKYSFLDMFRNATDPLLLFSIDENIPTIYFANKTIAIQFDSTPEDLNGEPLSLLFKNSDKMNEIDFNSPIVYEIEFMKKNGESFLSEASFHTFEMMGIHLHLLVSRDITQIRSFEKQLNIFDIIFTNSNESMFITDKHGIIQWTNDAFTRIYGYEKNEIIGRSTRVLSSGIHDKEFYSDMWTLIESTGSWVGEIWNKTKDGALLPVHQSVIKISLNGDNYQYASISIDLTESKLLDQRMYELAYIDPETKLKNRNSLYEFRAQAKQISIILLKFKNYNNIHLRFGESIADKMLKSILSIIDDINMPFELYRYDTKTFTFVLDHITAEYLSDFSKLLFERCNTPIEIDNILINPVISIGVSSFETQGKESLSKAMFEAESALHSSERHAYSNVVHFSNYIEDNMRASYDFRNAVAQAVKFQEFTVHFQPIIDIYSGALFSLEALARWYVDGEFIAPSLFIPEAESSNNISGLGLQILELSCFSVKEWKSIQPKLKLNVNVSLLQLEDANFVQSVKDILIKTNFSPSDLIIEITESISSQNSNTVTESLIALNALGIHLALDDFGTGFSSIQRLKDMPITLVKIDHGFVSNIDENFDDTSVITGMISLSHKIGLNVIAEGVENYEQLQILRNRNCRYVQGYLFSRPLNIKDTESYIKNYDPSKIKTGNYKNQLTEIDAFNQFNVQSEERIGTCTLDLEGIIIECNRNFSSIVGERKTELIGESINNFVKSESLDLIYDGKFEKDLTESPGIIHRIDGTSRYVVFSIFLEKLSHTGQKLVRFFIQDISENMDNELKILRIRQGYEKIFNNAPVMIMTWDKDYKIQEWNSTAVDLMGLTVEDVKQQSIFESIVPDSETKKWKTFTDNALSGKIENISLKLIDTSGRIHHCECFNDIVKNSSGEIDFVVTFMNDITETEKVKAHSTNMMSIIDNGPALIFMSNRSGEIIYRSKACFEIELLKTASNIDDLNVVYYDHSDNEVVPPDREKIDLWTSTGSISLNEDVSKRVRITILKEEASDISTETFAYIFMDFTKEYEQVQSISHLKTVLIDQERLAELGHLSAGIAHEINNPLSYMISSSGVLKDELESLYKIVETNNADDFKYLKTDIHEILEEFDEGLERIKTIVTGLRTYSWAGHSEELMPFDLNQSIEKILTIAHNEIKYNATVAVDLAELPVIEAIGSKISQVLLNLIINASHAIEKRESNDMGEIQISTGSDDNYIYCTIQDNGIGMSKEVSEKIFDAFFTTKPEGVGTGLGLSISKEIVVDIHHGDIRVDSEPGVGSKFTIALPIHQPKIRP